MNLSISRYGVSEALHAEFSMLREAQTRAGSIKYTRKTVDTLAQILVCRNYGSTCFEIAHLCWAIIFYAGQNGNNNIGANKRVKQTIKAPLLDYFWVQQVDNKASFIDYFTPCSSSDDTVCASPNSPLHLISNQDAPMFLSLKAAKLKLMINGHEFILHGDRANLWACLLEWLVCVSPDLLTVIEDSLQNKGQNAINALASTLQQKIYAYLTEHLPPAKLQRRYRQMDAWHLERARTENNATQINDESILLFWREHKQIEGFTKYRFVFSEHLAYMQAKDMVHTQAKLIFADSIENEQGQQHSQEREWDATKSTNESFYSVFSLHQAECVADLNMLSTRPKVFKQDQVELLEDLVQYPQYLSSLLRSWLRSMVFSKYQNQLIQAKRKHSSLAANEIISTPSDYQEVYSQSNKLIANNQLSLLALVDILMELVPKEGLFLLAKLTHQLPNLRVHTEQINQLLSQDISLDESTLPSARLKYPWFNAMLKQCKQARSKINRAGFTDKTMLTEDEYLQTASQLIALNKAFTKMLSIIRQQKLHSDENFHSDRFIFINELNEIYNQDGD